MLSKIRGKKRCSELELEKIRVMTRELVQLNELIETRTKDTQDDRKKRAFISNRSLKHFKTYSFDISNKYMLIFVLGLDMILKYLSYSNPLK